MMNTQNIVEQVTFLFRQFGNETYGEGMSVLSHSVQSAEIAEASGLDDELVMAALLHDIGHIYPLAKDEHVEMMDLFGTRHHEDIAKSFLGSYFLPERLIEPIAMHVDAKRYLCAADQNYINDLSEASRTTLMYQGGPMNEEERHAFENHEFFNEAIEIRKIDDAAKQENYFVGDSKLNYWMWRLEEYIASLKTIS